MRERAVRIAAWTALGIQPLFFAYWLIAGAVEPHYSPAREFVSEMGASTAARPWLLDGMLSLWGISLVAVALALRGVAPGPRWRWPVALLALAGVAAILDGPIHLSCAASIHPHCPGSESFSHRTHDVLATVNQAALALSGLAVACALWPHVTAKGLVVPSLIGVAFFLAGLLGTGDHDPHAGLAQRVGFVSAQGWIMLLAVCSLIADERTRVGARAPG